ncbi:MAG: heparinase II/III family protein, partial [Opitutaceae bacterium]
NYADGSPNIDLTPAFTWLAERYHHSAALAESRALLAAEIDRPRINDRFFALNAIWYPPSAAPDAGSYAEQVPLNLHFRGIADIAILRSAWDDPGAIFAGFKGGDNAANHSHLDLGTFVLDADGVRWADYLGADNYDLPDYFGNKRWTYFRLNNRSQNTLTPGDRLQDPQAVAPIIGFRDAPDRAFAVADLTAAYPDTAQRILRGIALLDQSRLLVQDDLLSLHSDTRLHWGMVTKAKITLSADGRTATLTQHGRTLCASLLAPGNAVFQVTSTRPPSPEENQNTGTAMLTIETTPAPGDIRLAVLLSPSGLRWPKLPPPVLIPVRDWR